MMWGHSVRERIPGYIALLATWPVRCIPVGVCCTEHEQSWGEKEDTCPMVPYIPV